MITFGIFWLIGGIVNFFFNLHNIITFVEDFIVVTTTAARIFWFVLAFTGHLAAGPAGIFLSYINNKSL